MLHVLVNVIIAPFKTRYVIQYLYHGLPTCSTLSIELSRLILSPPSTVQPQTSRPSAQHIPDPDRPLSIAPIPSAMASSSSNVVGVHYRVGKKIGEGSFGVIFEGTNLLNSQQVAIKFVCAMKWSETRSAY